MVRDSGSEPSSISTTLLERIRTRHPEAWRRLVQLYGPVVYRWCRQLGVSHADAPDVVQEVFAGVTVSVERFHRDSPEESFGAWLRTITPNKVFHHFRERYGRPNAKGGTDAYRQVLDLPDLPDNSSVQSNPLDVDLQFAQRVVEVVRAEFENHTWDAFWRIVVDGQSPSEVAQALGLSLPAVYQAKSRVLRRLRQEWKVSPR
jgi:RNA polymerase sigma-70 factor, ECF subfamily